MPGFDLILNSFATLFVTIDPIGILPIFLAVTAGLSAQQRRSVALRSTAIAFGLLVLFAAAGSAILEALGITIHAFRIAGGLLLFYIAFEMIFEKRQERHQKTAETITREELSSIAVFPMAIPMIAGPGAISAGILLAGNLGHSWEGFLVLIGLVAATLLIALALFLLADKVDAILGSVGRNIMTRLMGVLLAALSVQFVADGILALSSA